MSAADLMAVLLAEHLRYDFTTPDHPGNDRLIFSKGHASPLLYAMYRAAGLLDDDELLSFRALGSRLEGHPTPRLPWVDVATGSLGLGLPAGVGMALAAARLENSPYQVWVLCGSPSSPCTPCRARPARTSSCTPPGSTRKPSRRRPVRWSLIGCRCDGAGSGGGRAGTGA
jgi:hypothetical protein